MNLKLKPFKTPKASVQGGQMSPEHRSGICLGWANFHLGKQPPDKQEGIPYMSEHLDYVWAFWYCRCIIIFIFVSKQKFKEPFSEFGCEQEAVHICIRVSDCCVRASDKYCESVRRGRIQVLTSLATNQGGLGKIRNYKTWNISPKYYYHLSKYCLFFMVGKVHWKEDLVYKELRQIIKSFVIKRTIRKTWAKLPPLSTWLGLFALLASH